MVEQLELNLEGQVRIVVQSIVDIAEPRTSLRDIYVKVTEYNETLGLGYAADTLHNSVRRAIYDHLGDDQEGVFVRDGRGFYRLSVSVLVNVVIRGDSWKVIKLLPDACLDLVITDPPWTYMDKHRSWGTTTRLMQRKWFQTRDIDDDFIGQLARVLKDGSHLYLFFPALNVDTAPVFASVTMSMARHGITFSKGVVWDKEKMGMGYRYRYQHELVLFAYKGPKMTRGLNNLGVSDVIRCRRPQVAVHDCQKPDKLVEILLLNSSSEGEMVADFFAGSGVTGKVAGEHKRNWLMVDIGKEWTDHMEKALAPTRVLDFEEVQSEVASVPAPMG